MSGVHSRINYIMRMQMCTRFPIRIFVLSLLILCLFATPAKADSGEVFYFALPGNALGRERTISDIDNQRSVYQIVVERAPDPVDGNIDGGAATFALEFLYGGEVHTYKYWKRNSSGIWESEDFDESQVDYGSPVGIELETLFDPDGPDGSSYGPILTSTNDTPYGGVQDGVFRVVSDKPVRILLYNVDGPYTDSEVDTFPPATNLGEEDWPHYGNGQWSPDVTRLYPINNLGNEYTLNIDVPDRMVVNSLPKASVTVVATRDNTRLSFVASPLMDMAQDGSIPAPASGIILNRGQMWTMSADQYRLAMLEHEGIAGVTDPIPAYFIDSAINLLNGMKITATKPVAVITAGGCAAVRRSACDQTLAQLLPDRLQGTTYHIPLMQRGWMDAFDIRIVAVEDITDLKIRIKVPDLGSISSDPVTNQPDWNTTGVQVFNLVSSSAPDAGETEMQAGSMWDVVWSSLPYVGSPNDSAERPGINVANRRLTIGTIIDADVFNDNTDSSAWRNRLITENEDLGNPGELPSGTIMLGLSKDLPPCVVTIESSAKISVSISPKPWSADGFNNRFIQAPNGSQNVGGKVGFGALGTNTVQGGPWDRYYWDSECGFSLDSNSGNYWGLFGYTRTNPPNGVQYFEIAGIHTDPASVIVPPRERYSSQTSVSVPMALSDEYIGKPRSYTNSFNEEIAGYDLPLAHYVMLVVHEDYVVQATGVPYLAVRRRYNAPANTSLGIPASDTDWFPMSTYYNNSIQLSTNPGFKYEGTSAGIADAATACREAFFSNVTINQWTDGNPDRRSSAILAHDVGWIEYAVGPNEEKYYATVLRAIPLSLEFLDESLWTSSTNPIFSPYADSNNGDANDIQQGDFVPNIPVVTYDFAVGHDVNGNFVIDEGVNGVMAYSLGTGFFGTYAYAGSLPPEPTPPDQLTVIDQIAVAPGNTLDVSSVSFNNVPLAINDDFTASDYNGGESIILDVDLSGQTIAEGSTGYLEYELEVRSIEPGSTRLVGESTELEFFTYSPETNRAEQNTQERGPTSVQFGEGPIQLTVTLEDGVGGAITSPIVYLSPDEDINAHAELDFNTALDAFRVVLSEVDEFQQVENTYSSTHVIDQNVLGHDRYRQSTIMLDRVSSSTTSDFASTGTATLVIDAGRVVNWNSLILQESAPQPQVAGGEIAAVGSDMVSSLRVRTASSLGQLETWRANPTGAPDFITLAETIDGFPPTESSERIELSGVATLSGSRYLEIEITLLRADVSENLYDYISPVIESLVVGYTPESLQLKLDVVDSDAQSVLDLDESPVAYGIAVDLYDAFLSGSLTPAVDYRVRGRVVDQFTGLPLIEALSDPFEILLPDDVAGVLAGDVSTDRSSYGVGDVVRVSSRVENISNTFWTNDLTVSVEVYPYDGIVDLCDPNHGVNPAITFASYRIFSLESGSTDTHNFSFVIPNLDFPPGQYRVVQLIDNEAATSEILLCAVSDFVVRESTGETHSLAGTLGVSPRHLPTVDGNSQTQITYTLENTGNVGLHGLEIQIVGVNLSDPNVTEVVTRYEVPLGADGAFDIGATIGTESIAWTPSQTGAILLRYYAWASELTSGDQNDLGNWIELAVGSVINDQVGEMPDKPWHVAIALDPLTGDIGSFLGFDDFRGGINNRGVVVGSSMTSTADMHAAAWFNCPTPENLHAQLSFANPVSTYASDVADDGTIVGSFVDISGDTKAYIHSDHVGTFELTAQGTNSKVVASAVNSLGRMASVVGWKEDAGGFNTGVLWRRVYQITRSSGIIPEPFPLVISGSNIESSRLVDINDEGIAVGWYKTTSGEFGILWVGANDSVHLVSLLADGISLPGGDQTTDIRLHAISNLESGVQLRKVFGSYINTSGDEIPFYASLSTDPAHGSNGIGAIQRINIGLASDKVKPLDSAKGNTVVGTMEIAGSIDRAFLWEEDGSLGYDLNELILNENIDSLNYEWELSTAVSITGNRSIASFGTHESSPRAMRVERIPFSTEDLDSLHLWLRSDTGVVVDGSGNVTDWRDLTRGRFKLNDYDTMNVVVRTGSPTHLLDCCNTNVVLLDGDSSVSVDGLLDDMGDSIADEGTLAVVLTIESIATGDHSIMTLGSDTNEIVDLMIDQNQLLSLVTDGVATDLGPFEIGEPILLVIRQLPGGLAQVWRDQSDPQVLSGVSQLDWDNVSIQSSSSLTTTVGLAELMVFDRALSEASVEEVSDVLRKRHAVVNAVVGEDAVLWLRSDRGVEMHPAPSERVHVWSDQAGSWGDLSQDDPAESPEFVQGWFEQCTPSVYFDGNNLLDGVGPAHILVVFDHSGSMNQADMPVEPAGFWQECTDQGYPGTIPFPERLRFVHARQSFAEFLDQFSLSTNSLEHKIGYMHFAQAASDQLDMSGFGDGSGVYSKSYETLKSTLCYWSSLQDTTNYLGSQTWWSAWPGNSFGTGTRMDNALIQIVEDLVTNYPPADEVARRRAVIFLSDGDHNNGYHDLFESPGLGIAPLAALKANNIPVHTVGFRLGEPVDGVEPDAVRVMRTISELAGDGGSFQNAQDSSALSDSYLELLDNLTAEVSEATLSITLNPHQIPQIGQAPRVILQTGLLESGSNGESANGLNVWLSDDQVHIGVWWESQTGDTRFRSMSAPMYEETGFSQLVISIDSYLSGLRLSAYLNGVPFTVLGSAPAAGVPSSGGGGYTNANGLGLQDAIRIESRSLVLGALSLGGSPVGKVRDGSLTTPTSAGFIGDVVELIVYDKELNGEELERLFTWGRDRYGAGSLTQGYAPVAIATGGGVGELGLFDTDYDGVESVVLDASQTYDPDDQTTSLSYRWYLGDVLIGTGMNTTLDLARGRHHVTLQVQDFAGHIATDQLVIDVNRVHQHIKPVDLSFNTGPLQAVGDPVPIVMDISPVTTSLLTIAGSTPTYQTGRKASSIKLDGSALLDLSDAESEIPSGASPRTYSIWFETGVTAHDEPTLFVQSDEAGEHTFEITGNSRRIAYTVDGYTRGVEWTNPVDQLPVGWHHLAVVVSRGAIWSDQVRMYLNGEEQLTVPLDGSGAAGPLYTGSNKAYIGGNPIHANAVVSYQGGRVDEAQIFTGALSASEVLDLFADVPVASWGFESQSGSYAYASTQVVPTNIGTLVLSEHYALINQSGRLALGKKGGASTAGAVFDTPEGNWTIMFKIQPLVMTSDLDPLISDSTGALLMLHEDSNQVPLLYVATTGNSVPAPSLFDGAEHWITIVSRKGYPGVTDGTFLFVDSAIDFNLPVSTSSTMLDGGPITIAGPNGNDGGFEGTVDDFHIFSRPLTQQECLSIVGQ